MVTHLMAKMAAIPDDCERTATVALPTDCQTGVLVDNHSSFAALDGFSTVFEPPLYRSKNGHTHTQKSGHERPHYLAVLRPREVTSYRAPTLALHSHYWWLHSLRISCDSAARLWRNAIKTFHHTIVCVTTVTVPVHLHGTNFAPFLLLTRRCYDTETSTILLLLKRAFA